MPARLVFAPALALALTLLAAAAGEAARAGEAGVRELAASHLRGQTFVTWTELAGRDDAEYRVYRSKRSFHLREPEAGELAGTVRAGSAALHFERPGEGFGHGLERKAIADRSRGGRPLARGTGLFVWTAAEEGPFHYCVLASIAGRIVEREGQSGRNATDRPVGEAPGPPAAVELASTGPAGWYYLMHGDFREWSRAGVDDLWGGTAWSFHVALPGRVDPEERLPVRVALHGYGAQGARYGSTPAGGRLVYISAQDWQDGLWWGWARSLRPAGPQAWPPAGGRAQDQAGPVEPYAARRLGRIVEWAAAGPDNLAARTDPERIYLYGHSTGGSGALSFVLSGQPGAGRVAGVVATMFPTSWRPGGPWEDALARVWGARRLGLPAAGLDAGRGAFETVSPLELARRAARRPPPFEPPLVELSLGTADRLAPADELGELCAALEAARVPFFAHWGKYGHEGARLSGSRNRAFDVRRSEPLLAFARARCNGRPGVDAAGGINTALEWSAPANDFDPASRADDFVDAVNGCAFSVRLVAGAGPDRTAADITPRRLRLFRPRPGTKCAWRALGPAAAGGGEPAELAELASGAVAADAAGLVTLPQVPILAGGSGTRVVVTEADRQDDPAKPGAAGGS